MKPIHERADFIDLDELALTLVNGGEFDPDKTPSGEPDAKTGKELTCTQVFAQGHCSGQCVGALLEDWKRLKGLQPPGK